MVDAGHRVGSRPMRMEVKMPTYRVNIKHRQR